MVLVRSRGYLTSGVPSDDFPANRADSETQFIGFLRDSILKNRFTVTKLMKTEIAESRPKVANVFVRGHPTRKAKLPFKCQVAQFLRKIYPHSRPFGV